LTADDRPTAEQSRFSLETAAKQPQEFSDEVKFLGFFLGSTSGGLDVRDISREGFSPFA